MTSPAPIPPSADAADPATVTMTLKDALELGRKQHLAGHLEAAELIYKAILRVKPRQQEALHFLGLLAHQTGHTEAALELIVDAVEVDPAYVDAINNLGNVLMHLGMIDRAEAAYRRAIELNPNFPDPYSNVAAVLNLQGKPEEAVSMCIKAIELTPQLPDSELQSGEALAAEGQPALAADAYRIALMRQRFQPDLYTNLGHALARLGKLDEAAELYRSWLRFDPENPRPRHHLASCTGVGVPERASDDYVRQTFDRFSKSFDNVLQRLEYAAPTRVQQTIVAELGEQAPCELLLDAGCGTGLCGPLLRPLAHNLVGVDLSAGMLERARERSVYDDLHQAELTEFLGLRPQTCDVICAADVLEYFGDMHAVCRAAATALKPGGLIVFTVEKATPEEAPNGYRLQYHGRFSHTDDYLRRVLTDQGFEVTVCQEIFLRKEAGLPVTGWLVAARSQPPVPVEVSESCQKS